jgi:cysteine desulfurase/selenocysteine lyase
MRWRFSKGLRRADTMSTIDAGEGPLDVDMLARLANEYFSAWPGADLQTPARPSPQAFGLDQFSPNFSPRTVSLPGEAELRALLEPLRSAASDDAAGRVTRLREANLDAARVPFDVNLIRRDFPILTERVNGRPLVWLDNAATTQKPQAVIDRLKYFYEHENSNIHRAAHELAARATDAYEGARERVRGFLNASSTNEVVFVRGATEAINLVAQSWGRQNVGKDDEIVVTWLEHHANIVPWQQLANEKGARLRVAPVDDTGQVILEEYGKLLGPRTRLVALPQVSNALGTVTPAKPMVQMAHGAGAKVLVDGAQSVSHIRTDVQALNSDWYVFSGHKMFGPTGIGVLHGKEALLNEMTPWQGGGNMIEDVTFEQTRYRKAPARFEAGTGNIADAVGLGAAIDYLSRVGLEPIENYEHQLLNYATRLLKEIPGLRLIGTAAEKAGVISFVLSGYKTEDIGTALNHEGIAVRAGHHCAQPVLRRFGVETTVRASLALYNTCADIDSLVMALTRLSSRRRHG